VGRRNVKQLLKKDACRPIAALNTLVLGLARAWIHPPAIKIAGSPFSSDGYNQDQRAYLLKRVQPGGSLEVELAGNPDAPVFNPAFVIQGWGENEAALKVAGAEVPRGRSFRYGHRHTLDGTDLVVWIKTESERPVRIAICATK
jgi:hypothetical protein